MTEKRFIALVAVTVLALGTTADAGGANGPKPADLPTGQCDGEWRDPSVAVDFGNVSERPYSGFRLSAMFDAAREYEGAFGEGFIKTNRDVLKASFVFTRDPEERAQELRAITAYPENIRVLRACYSIRALSRIQDVIGRELLNARNPVLRLRSDVVFSDIDVRLNQAEIGLENYNESDERKVIRRYGDVVRVFPRDADIEPARE